MTNRRRLLLSYLANSFKYLHYSYEYLYYGLVPTTIDSKQVRNKAKVSKLYGNSVVENQYIPTNQNTETKNGITFTNNGDGSWTISGTASADTSKKCGAMFLTQNHKYLLKGCKNGSSTTYYLQDENVNSSKEYGSGNIYTYSYTWSTNICIYVKSGTVISTPITIFPQLIDLTQQYPFNTPTTLTDNRVQAILNRGYIPFNLGELKSVDIGEISTAKADTSALQTIPFKYQGSGVGTAHDTYELTNTSHVFTKNMSIVDLGSFSFEKATIGGHIVFRTILIPQAKTSINDNVVGNILCSKYKPTYFNDIDVNNADNCVVLRGISPEGISIRDSSKENLTIEQFKTDIANVPFEYQLATPQVITIPRKHLGIVDLGSLNWTKSNQYGFYSSGLSSLVKKPDNNNITPNIYCSKFMTSYRSSNSYQSTNSMVITIDMSGDLDVSYDNTITAEQFKQIMSGVYLFYETENEVADITDTFDIESGGTINTNWLTWVENQLLANGNFEDTSGWRIINGTASVSNNILTQTITSIGSHKWGNGVYVESFNPPLNHKYLCIAYVKPKYNGNCLIGTGYTSNLSNNISIVANAWNLVCAIVENTTNSGAESRFSIAVDCTTNYQVGDTIDYIDAQCIDLTLGFGAGNEPTDINDYRIQYILKYGYIPTNLTGTEKHIQNEVLANADFLMKCK